MNKTKIEGVSINLDALKTVTDLSALKATGIFISLPEDKQADSYNELAKQLGVTNESVMPISESDTLKKSVKQKAQSEMPSAPETSNITG